VIAGFVQRFWTVSLLNTEGFKVLQIMMCRDFRALMLHLFAGEFECDACILPFLPLTTEHYCLIVLAQAVELVSVIKCLRPVPVSEDSITPARAEYWPGVPVEIAPERL